MTHAYKQDCRGSTTFKNRGPNIRGANGKVRNVNWNANCFHLGYGYHTSLCFNTLIR